MEQSGAKRIGAIEIAELRGVGGGTGVAGGNIEVIDGGREFFGDVSGDGDAVGREGIGDSFGDETRGVADGGEKVEGGVGDEAVRPPVLV